MKAVGRAIGAVVWTVVGVVVVVGPWLVQRAVRVDPLGGAVGWQRRTRRLARPTHASLPDARPPRPARLRVARGAIAVVVVLLAAALTPPGRDLISGHEDPVGKRTPFQLDTPAPPKGFDVDETDFVDPDLPEYVPTPEDLVARGRAAYLDTDEWRDAEGWVTWAEGPWRPVDVHRVVDFESRYINVVDSRRVTWTPPPCDCERLTVWMLGGSTTWGAGQRDDHTIASELAKVAYEHGVVLDVENHAELAYLHWLEAQRFAADLTTQPPPDLAFFYDGVNESWSSSELVGQHTGDVRAVIDPITTDLWQSAGKVLPTVPEGPEGSAYVGPGPRHEMSDEEWATTNVARYERSRTISKATADAYDVPVRYFWQPNRFTRKLVPTEWHASGRLENQSRATEQVIRSLLADDVIDLGDVLDDVDEPVYTDDVHHDERASRIIAEAIWEHLAPDLAVIAAQKP